MSGQSWTVNSDASLEACKKWLSDLYAEHKYLTVAKPRLGKDRSLTQNNLFHAWITEMVAWSERKDSRDVDDSEKLSMKKHVKKKFLQSYPECYSWVVIEYKDRETKQVKKDLRSSAKYKTGEMFMMLTFMQDWCAMAGLHLESKGEFAKKQREQK